MGELTIWLAGAPIVGARDKVHRYCGLPWSGGPPEAWAFRFYDFQPRSDPNEIWSSNLMVCSVLHHSITRENLRGFARKVRQLEALLEDKILDEVDLADCRSNDLEGVFEIADLADEALDLELLTKMLHKKRPRMIPLFTKHLQERYRHLVMPRGEASWPELVVEFKKDLEIEENRLALSQMREELGAQFCGDPISELRIADIALFMESKED
jgi:Family of unknown function (DUF6308)